MKNNDLLEKWKLSKLINLLEKDSLVKLPHQRPLNLKKGAEKRFIKSALENKLLQNFILSDLKSSYDYSYEEEDKEFFFSYLEKDKKYSIEDCQHRLASLQSITSNLVLKTENYFTGEFEGRVQEFYDVEVPVLIVKDRTRGELVSDFGEVNSGKSVTNDNLVWGVNNQFNNYIKNKFIGNEKLLCLYKTKKKSAAVERTLYGNILKIIKVCASYDGVVKSPKTNAESMMSFIKSNLSPNNISELINLFDVWYEYIKTNQNKESFTTQSNLFFIIHILNKKKIVFDENLVNTFLPKLTDTRSSAEKRYTNILKMIEDER
jgi:hypothetical protein